MKTVHRYAVLVFFLSVSAALTFADEPGKHPAYLHALSNLRYARALLERPTASYHMNAEEQHAIEAISAGIQDIKHASIDDGKNVNDHPPVDAHEGHKGRYRRALDLLDKAHGDVAREEDEPGSRGLRDRALGHIDEAHRIVDHLIMQARD